jgi:hypothetical protein
MEKGWKSKFSSIILTKERLGPKPPNTAADVGALECYIKVTTMLDSISAFEMKCCTQDLNS